METVPIHNPLEDDLNMIAGMGCNELGREVVELAATTTAFEELAEEPRIGSTVEGPVMTETTWDHSTKQTDSRDVGGGFDSGSAL